MTNLLTGYLEDRSTAQYFCFSISCEVCGEFWYRHPVGRGLHEIGTYG